MRIAITGSPGAGKTSFAKKLAEDLKIDYVTIPVDWIRRNESDISELSRTLGLLEAYHGCMVTDRSYITILAHMAMGHARHFSKSWDIFDELISRAMTHYDALVYLSGGKIGGGLDFLTKVILSYAQYKHPSGCHVFVDPEIDLVISVLKKSKKKGLL